MTRLFRLIRLRLGLTMLIAAASLVACQAPAAPAQPPQSTTPLPVESPATRPSSITMVVTQEPTGFNGLVTDTCYEQLVGELVYLAVSEIDPQGNIYPELAVEIPTLENGGVALDAGKWIRLDMARFRFDPGTGSWKLYYTDADSAWHAYYLRPRADFEMLLREVDEDPVRVFWWGRE